MIHQDTTMVYNEVDALSTLLGYQVQNAGCCKVVFHPTWGSAVYPSTLFAIAPMEEVRAFEHSPNEGQKKKYREASTSQ